MNLTEALKSLDVSNDSHWTAQGLPSVAAVREIMNDQSITRDEIRLALPSFDRTNAAAEKETPVLQDTMNSDPTDTSATQSEAPAPHGDTPPADAPPVPDPAMPPPPPEPVVPAAPAESPVPDYSGDKVLQEKEIQANVLRQKISDITQEMNNVKNEMAARSERLTVLQKTLDVTQRKLDKVIGPEDDFRMANLAYLETQKRNLEANAERMREFKAMQLAAQDARYPVDKQYDMGRYGRLHGPIHPPKS